MADLSKRIERAELAARSADQPLVQWQPLPGPQTIAFESAADVIGFGGAAGGGKSFLGIGLALMQHQRVAIFRRHATEMTAIVDEIAGLLGHRDGLNQVQGIWRLPGRVLEFGSVPNAGDERKYQGRAKDFLFIDEATNFLEQQVRFLAGWVRTTDPTQRTRTLLAFNPPTNAEGRWVIQYFAPWLDRKFPDPAQPGELRYVAVVDGKDTWVPDARPFILDGAERVYDFDPADYTGSRQALVVRPQSRTFIPSRVTDNPHLVGTAYLATLQALPEPLRSQMLHGSFEAGIEDDAFQVVPTAWVEAAMARWQKRSPKPPMEAIGVDVARGGRDETVLARRHRLPTGALWFDELVALPGTSTPDGQSVAAQVIAARRDSAALLLDVVGVGSSPFDFLRDAVRGAVLGVNVAERAGGTDKSGRLAFFNQRSELWWRVREALDPLRDTGIELPPDQRLLADLCAPRWSMSGTAVRVEGRDEIVKRIGRSPDRASALILCFAPFPPVNVYSLMHDREEEAVRQAVLNYDPLAGVFG